MWRLGDFDSEAFIRDYWQKKPCVLRNAFPEFESPISPEELAGLACEEDVHCRLVFESLDGKPWQLRYGPFEEQDFLDLPEKGYSLLVSECEKWLPELNDLLEQFRFIPDWRIDDLMISYAPEQSSVGAHVDEYDVFLLQAMGSRNWFYNETRTPGQNHLPNTELAILQEFVPQQNITLNPGDMLYLPPGCAHHGIAIDRCMTYSIGFRAPTSASVLESFALEVGRESSHQQRYGDPDLEHDRHHAEITDMEIDRFRKLALELLEQPASVWHDVVGKMLSDSPVAKPEDDDQPVYVSDLQSGNWIRHPETRLFYHLSEENIEVYYNGKVHHLPRDPEALELLQQLCDQHEWPVSLLSRCIETESLQKLLIELASNAAILPIDD